MNADTPEEMRQLGERLAAVARPGDLYVLAGPLGAGKTVLTQGIGRGLGVRAPVVSPTFVIARAHRDGRIPLVHVDAYRLSSMDEVDDLDLDATVEESLTVVEWGQGLVEGLARDRLEIQIRRAEDEDDDSRRVDVTAVGDRWSGVSF